ncbi:MAG TPA: methyltransferase, partial [Anaerolineae bacterium]|nr:methyltransferase [Anaerolineae bacterium]
MRLKWRNVPVPEGHVFGIVAGTLLQHARPPRFRLPRWLRRWVGPPLILLGAGLALWAATTAGDTELSTPDTLVTHGPYALSRNPMYVGWTLIYLGFALVADAGWVL